MVDLDLIFHTAHRPQHCGMKASLDGTRACLAILAHNIKAHWLGAYLRSALIADDMYPSGDHAAGTFILFWRIHIVVAPAVRCLRKALPQTLKWKVEPVGSDAFDLVPALQ